MIDLSPIVGTPSGGDIPTWWRNTSDINSTLSVKVRAVIGAQPGGDTSTFEPSVSVEHNFWGGPVVSAVPIGDLYVQCVIHCGNRVIGSPHTRTQSVGVTVDKRKKPNGEKADPKYVFDAVWFVYTCRRLIDLSLIVYTCRRLIDLSNYCRYVFDEDLDTNARVLELPRKARLVFKVRSVERRSKSTVLGETVAFGVLPLFDIRGRLVSGARELCLWPVGLSNPSMLERGEWLTPKREGALSASQNLHHRNPVVLVVHVNQPVVSEAGGGGPTATGSPGSPSEGVAGSEPIYHGDVFRKVQLKFTDTERRISFVSTAQAEATALSTPGALDTTVGDSTALASLEPSSSVEEELEALESEEMAFRRALEFPVAIYQNQSLPLTPEPASLPSCVHNVDMPTWSDHAGRPIFPVANIRPALAESALREHVAELDFTEVHYDLALRAYLNSFDLTNWLEPTKISAAIDVFIGRYCECNPQFWTAWRPMAHKLAMETIRLYGNTDRISHHDFVAAVGASENGSETELSLAKYIRGMYTRIAQLSELRDDVNDWDSCYTVGNYGQDSHDERALHLKSAIELIINGSQILDIGWGWKTDSRWSIGRNQAVDTDADGWSYAADWQSCWYCSQNDVI